MKRLWLSLVLISLASGALAGGKGDFRRNPKAIPDHYIVVLDERRVADVSVGVASNSLARDHGLWLDRVYEHALKGFAAVMSEAQAKALSHHPLVEWVEEDGVVEAFATQQGATWGLDRIDQRNLPLNSTYTYNFTGSGVRVYIIDTGIRASHFEFGGRVAPGFTAINDGRGTDDCAGHGTHVAGTVGGATYGVAKSVTLVPVRVLDCGGFGTISGIVAGVDWVTLNHAAGQPAVANMSLGGGVSSSLDAAVNNSINDGVTYAIAAGNSDPSLDSCFISPARVAAAITVAATDSSDAKPSWSSYGECMDIFAPGVFITSSWNSSDSATNTISGTSMAAPHVAGVAALYLQTNPSASPSMVWGAIRDSSTPNKVTNPGAGSPNRLLYSLLTSAPPPPSYQGNFEIADCNSIIGWAWDRNQPNTPINVDIYDGGTFVVRVAANLYRQDLVNAGIGNGYHGFNIATPVSLKNGQDHSVSVVFAGTTTNLSNSPRNLYCPVPALYQGYLDGASCSSILGWAWDRNQPNTPISVDIYDNGAFAVRVVANLFRQDLVNAGIGNGYHGFNIATPSRFKDGQTHSVSVVFGGTTTNLVASPRSLTCGAPPPPPPSYQGYLDGAGCSSILGWAWDRNQPNTPISVDIYDHGVFVRRVLANLFRQDLVNAGIGNGYHGFNIATPSRFKDGQTHSAKVVFAGTMTSLVNSPQNVTCAGSDTRP